MDCFDCKRGLICTPWTAADCSQGPPTAAVDIVDYECPSCGTLIRGTYSGVYDPRYMAAQHNHRSEEISDPGRRTQFNYCLICKGWYEPIRRSRQDQHDPEKCGCSYLGNDAWSCGHLDHDGGEA